MIANESFADPRIPPLSSPRSDSESLAGVLRHPDIGDFEVDVVVDGVTRDVLMAVSRTFSQADTDTTVLLHLSGHGMAGPRGLLYCTADTDPDWPDATCMTGRFLSDCMNRSEAKAIVVILDCCFSGSFAGDLIAKRVGSDEAATELRGKGRAVITSSTASQQSFEFPGATGGSTSVFTRAVVEGISTGAADADGDGVITLDELYAYAHEVVIERAMQTPSFHAWEIEGPLMIARTPLSVPRSPAIHVGLLQALENPYPSVRTAALNEIGKLQRSVVPERAAAARELLLQIRRGDDAILGPLATTLVDEHTRWKRRTRRRTSSPRAAGPPTGEPWFQVAEGDLQNALQGVGIARGRDPALPLATCFLVEPVEDFVRFLATDNYRLAFYDAPASVTNSESAVVVGDELVALPLKRRDRPVQWFLGSDAVEVETSTAAFGIDRFPHSFPAYRKLLPDPEANNACVEVNRDDFLTALEEVRAEDVGSSPVLLETASTSLTVSALTEPTVRRMVRAKAAAGLRIAFNPSFLIDGVWGVGSETVTFIAQGQLRPAFIEGDSRFRYLVMPVRTE